MIFSNYKHWKLVTDNNNILWVDFDRDNYPVNSFNQEVMDELSQLTEEIERIKPQGVVVSSAKKNGFIAGADITQFSDLKTQEEAFDLIRQGQLVFDKWERLSVPTVALINGFCLGGGYEFALSCRYRIALDDAKTKIGLPEIKRNFALQMPKTLSFSPFDNKMSFEFLILSCVFAPILISPSIK